MEENNTDYVPKVKESSNKTNGRGKSVLSILLALFFLAIIGLSFLYINSRQKISERSSEITSLKARILTLEALVSADGTDALGESANCAGGSAYTADIGKFSIELDTPRVIIRDLDAGFEGGPITSLEIGTCLADVANVVDTPPTAEVKILGHPASSSSDLRSAYESRAGMALAADGTITIAGVTANKYTLDGLFQTTVIYFDNAGIGYEIELSDTNDTTNAILADVTSDWTFTP